MECNLFPRIVTFLAIIIFILIHLPASLCAANKKYERCGRVDNCGNITITYPFFANNELIRPSYCGAAYYGFALDCRDNQIFTTIGMFDFTYRVLDINNSAQTLTIARNDYWDTYCPTDYLNTTIDSPFSGFLDSVYGSILMYYGCPSNITGYSNHQFTCVRNRTNTVGYYFMSFRNSMALDACDIYVSIPAFPSAMETLNARPSKQNLIAALHGGFDLSWDANNGLCSACVESGGRCGSNLIAALHGGFARISLIDWYVDYLPDSIYHPVPILQDHLPVPIILHDQFQTSISVKSSQ